MKVVSRENMDGQNTVATISINARIMQEFEVRWIDTFIRIVHQHRDRIGTKTLKANIKDYLKELKATMIKIDFDYPFFMEKITPVSKEKCLVRYLCRYSVKTSPVDNSPRIFFRIEVPAITTYPGSAEGIIGGLFGQLTIVLIEVEIGKEIYPENLVDIVDRNALSPVYSYLSADDQHYIIQKIHSEVKSSIDMTDGIKKELARDKNIEWYSVCSSNYGMLHSYSTAIRTEKNIWVPNSGYEE